MAGYLSPGAYFYAEEQEYLQAYEDVLERYKGRAALPAPCRRTRPGCWPRRVWRLRTREALAARWGALVAPRSCVGRSGGSGRGRLVL